MESLDYRYFTVHFNKHTARYQSDGSVVLILAHADPNGGGKFLGKHSPPLSSIDCFDVFIYRGILCCY